MMNSEKKEQTLCQKVISAIICGLLAIGCILLLCYSDNITLQVEATNIAVKDDIFNVRWDYSSIADAIKAVLLGVLALFVWQFRTILGVGSFAGIGERMDIFSTQTNPTSKIYGSNFTDEELVKCVKALFDSNNPKYAEDDVVKAFDVDKKRVKKALQQLVNEGYLKKSIFSIDPKVVYTLAKGLYERAIDKYIDMKNIKHCVINDQRGVNVSGKFELAALLETDKDVYAISVCNIDSASNKDMSLKVQIADMDAKQLRKNFSGKKLHGVVLFVTADEKIVKNPYVRFLGNSEGVMVCEKDLG